MNYSSFKRLADFGFSLTFILILSPFLVLIVILLNFTGEGEVIYKQKRKGLNNQTFHLLKFASMLKDSMNLGFGATTIRNDPRITPMGRYLRITKINELPQLFNVLNGEMSLIGPRPLPEKSFLKYEKEVQNKLYKIRPGITGIGSLIFRDEEKLITEVNHLGKDTQQYYREFIYPYKGKAELWYQDNFNLKTDLLILLLTVIKIFFTDSKLEWKFFKSLPPKPSELESENIKFLDLNDAQ